MENPVYNQQFLGQLVACFYQIFWEPCFTYKHPFFDSWESWVRIPRTALISVRGLFLFLTNCSTGGFFLQEHLHAIILCKTFATFFAHFLNPQIFITFVQKNLHKLKCACGKWRLKVSRKNPTTNCAIFCSMKWSFCLQQNSRVRERMLSWENLFLRNL